MGQKRGSKSFLMANLLQFLQGHPKPAFSEKVQRGDQGKFFKNCRKSNLLLKSLKAVAQMALSSNQNALKVQRLDKILQQKRGSKSFLMAKSLQFSQGHPKLAFSEKVQRRDQGNFPKIAQKVALV